MMGNRKKVAALICGMFGCVFLGSGDWLMMYGNTAYHGQVYWLTEGVAQIPAWRNSLSMLVAFLQSCYMELRCLPLSDL